MSGESPGKQYIQIRRLPSARTFLGHQIGLTIAFFLAGLTLVLNIFGGGGSPFVNLGLLLLFFWGTRIGGLFLGLAAVAAIVGFAVSPSGLWHYVFTVSQLYVAAYLAGRLFGEIYNVLVFFFITNFERHRTRISFVYDPASKINVIKSPLEEELHTLHGPGKLEKRQLKAELLYDASLPADEIPGAPYTILIVANPYLKTGDGENEPYEHDAILRDRALFLRSVDRCLNSLASDIVVGMDAIWSRIRIVTLFDADLVERVPAKEYALARPGKLNIDDTLIDNLLSPADFHRKEFVEYFENVQDGRGRIIPFADVDVIIALSASEEFTRSSAVFTDYPQLDSGDPGPETGAGIPFNVTVAYGEERSWDCLHEYRASIPGRAAINVVTARAKTYIHEFAHAMSSAVNGAIMDEYADDFAAVGAENEEVTGDAGGEDVATIREPLIINRLEQNWPAPNPFYPIPPVFAIYNGLEFYSDQYHPSDDGTWLGYFPDRVNQRVPCTMDASGIHHTFDRLIRAFMYDRIMAKMQREPVEAGQEVETREGTKEKEA